MAVLSDDHISSLESELKWENYDVIKVRSYFSHVCHKRPDVCTSLPDKVLKLCESHQKTDCRERIRLALRMRCMMQPDFSLCNWLLTTTIPTTTKTNMLPIIIGCAVGAVVLIAIGIALFFYCRKKKKSGAQGQSMAGSNVGGTANSGTTTGVTTTATGSRY